MADTSLSPFVGTGILATHQGGRHRKHHKYNGIVPRSRNTLAHAVKQEVVDGGWRQRATSASTVLLRILSGVLAS